MSSLDAYWLYSAWLLRCLLPDLPQLDVAHSTHHKAYHLSQHGLCAHIRHEACLSVYCTIPAKPLLVLLLLQQPVLQLHSGDGLQA